MSPDLIEIAERIADTLQTAVAAKKITMGMLNRCLRDARKIEEGLAAIRAARNGQRHPIDSNDIAAWERLGRYREER